MFLYLHVPQVGRLATFPGMDRFQHGGYYFTHLSARHVGEHIALEADHTPLPVSIRKDLGNRFDQSDASI